MNKLNNLAVLAVALGVQQVSFPVTLDLCNNTYRTYTEPETRAVVGPESRAPMTVHSADQFIRVCSNLDQLNFLGGWEEGTGLSLEPRQPDTGAAEAEAAAKAEAEAQAQADEQAKVAADAAAKAEADAKVAAEAEAKAKAESDAKAAADAEAAAKAAAAAAAAAKKK